LHRCEHRLVVLVLVLDDHRVHEPVAGEWVGVCVIARTSH
jgi:hypothetical protein